jgi:polysaccharide pyruvyl transferase WcaK-like protein
VGISYDPKVSGFMNYLGSEDCVDLEKLDGPALCTMIDHVMNQDHLPENSTHLKALAEENGYLAGELLRE